MDVGLVQSEESSVCQFQYFRCLPHWMPLPSIRSVWQHMARHAQRISGAQVLKPSHTAVGFIQQSIPLSQKPGNFLHLSSLRRSHAESQASGKVGGVSGYF